VADAVLPGRTELGDPIWVRVLGPVGIRDSYAGRRAPGPQLRLLLAFFTLAAGQVVPVSDLVDALWQERPPSSARASLQILIARLRKSLAVVPACRLDRYGDGYQLQIGQDQVDVYRFRSLVAVARQTRSDDDGIDLLGHALSLWRGPALADVPSTPRIDAIRSGLAEEHVSAAQDRYGRLLAAGRDAEAAAEIPLMLARHPLAERLVGMLMTARYRCGRQADALQAFRELRGRLVGELGVEPGAELQRLHQQVLSGDLALAVPADHAGLRQSGTGATRGRRTASPGRPQPRVADAPEQAGPDGDTTRARTRDDRQPSSRPWPAQPGTHQQIMAGHAGVEPPSPNGSGRPAGAQDTAIPAPRQLPAAPTRFTGRQRELDLLTGWLDTGGTAGPVILTISGAPGVGKTALALQWAQHMQHRFPDGQLYANLRGFDASPAPVRPGEAISGFLESLGVPARQISPRLEAREGLYRSLLADKRILIVLDNARDEAQVRPLLPGSAACVVLVTSRSELTGLVAAEGARPLMLDVLTELDARQLLASRIGAARAAAEADAVSELISLCAHLPLALAIAAARAATRPGFPLSTVTAGLRGARHRLDGLDAGEHAADIRAAFSWSYRLLSEPAATMFRLLDAHPGPDISVAAAASLAAVSAPSARAALAELVKANLLQEQSPDRFTLHDLLRAYVADLCEDNERRSAARRVLDYYLHTARAAIGLAYPTARKMPIAPPDPATAPERLTREDQAVAWLQAEHRVLLAAAGAAASSGLYMHAWQLPAVLGEYLARGGHYLDWAQAQQTALAAAVHLGDRAARACAHSGLGEALIQLGSCTEARDHLHDALDLYRNLGDRAGQAACQCGSARICEARGDHSRALYHAARALRLYRAVGDQVRKAAALNGVGWYYALLGDDQRALSYCGKALELQRETGNRFGEAATLDSLGYCHHQAGRHSQAITFYQQALSAYADAGDRYFRAHTLIHLGETYRASGNPQATREAWQQGLAILDDLHHHDAGPIRAKLKDMIVSTSRP
jgi:DNA-binding SARP family transcriptional activator/tetratricopeptide (TPR) repeat protein